MIFRGWHGMSGNLDNIFNFSHLYLRIVCTFYFSKTKQPVHFLKKIMHVLSAVNNTVRDLLYSSFFLHPTSVRSDTAARHWEILSKHSSSNVVDACSNKSKAYGHENQTAARGQWLWTRTRVASQTHEEEFHSTIRDNKKYISDVVNFFYFLAVLTWWDNRKPKKMLGERIEKSDQTKWIVTNEKQKLKN